MRAGHHAFNSSDSFFFYLSFLIIGLTQPEMLEPLKTRNALGARERRLILIRSQK